MANSTPTMIKMVYQDKHRLTKKRYARFSFLNENESYPLEVMTCEYEATTEKLRQHNFQDFEKLAMEDYRLALMESIYIQLANIQSVPEKKRTLFEKFIRGIKIALLIFAGVVGMADTAIWTYFGAQEALLLAIPGAIAAALIPLSIIFTVIAVVQFFGFEMDQVKEMLGIKIGSKSRELLETHEKQIRLTKKINAILLTDIHTINQLTTPQYQDYSNIAVQFNNDVIYKKSVFKEYKEHPLKKCLRYAMTAAGIILISMEVYLGTTLLLGTFMAPLVGTPIGWGIIAALTATYIILFLSMRGSGMDTLFNSIHTQSLKVKQKLNEFIPKSINDFTNILLNKHFFSSKFTVGKKVPPDTDTAATNNPTLTAPVTQRKRAHSFSMWPASTQPKYPQPSISRADMIASFKR